MLLLEVVAFTSLPAGAALALSPAAHTLPSLPLARTATAMATGMATMAMGSSLSRFRGSWAGAGDIKGPVECPLFDRGGDETCQSPRVRQAVRHRVMGPVEHPWFDRTSCRTPVVWQGPIKRWLFDRSPVVPPPFDRNPLLRFSTGGH